MPPCQYVAAPGTAWTPDQQAAPGARLAAASRPALPLQPGPQADMRHILVTLMLLGLITGAGLAPRGQADTTGGTGGSGGSGSTNLTAADFITEFYYFKSDPTNPD